jgi:hypothetical protein
MNSAPYIRFIAQTNAVNTLTSAKSSSRKPRRRGLKRTHTDTTPDFEQLDVQPCAFRCRPGALSQQRQSAENASAAHHADVPSRQSAIDNLDPPTAHNEQALGDVAPLFKPLALRPDVYLVHPPKRRLRVDSHSPHRFNERRGRERQIGLKRHRG